jgi:hypothetical protein
MKKLILNFLKKYWLYILLAIILFVVGFKLFYNNKNVNQLNQSVIEKQYENKLLNQYLEIEKRKSDSLKIEIDSLYKKWQTNSTVNIINNNKHDKERLEILTANNDKQFIIFSKWVSKTNSNK